MARNPETPIAVKRFDEAMLDCVVFVREVALKPVETNWEDWHTRAVKIIKVLDGNGEE